MEGGCLGGLCDGVCKGCVYSRVFCVPRRTCEVVYRVCVAQPSCASQPFFTNNVCNTVMAARPHMLECETHGCVSGRGLYAKLAVMCDSFTVVVTCGASSLVI